MKPHNYTMNGTGSERVRFFARQLITADDMMAEQQYFRQKLRRHNRFLHGWGVVCGLKVIAVPTEELPWRVKIEAGYALGPYGDEIYVADPFCFDLATCQEMVPDPCEPGEPPKPVRPKGGKLYLAIRYLECETRPVRIHPLGCACDDTLCEYSRIRDDFEIGCRPEPPAIQLPLLCDLLGRKELAPCPPCPDSGWVVLAEITLPKKIEAEDAPSESMPKLKDQNIDNFVRRQLFSTALLQEQLIECCCEERREPAPRPQAFPARVTKIDPANDSTIEDFGDIANLTIDISFDKELQPGSVNENTVLVAGFRETQKVNNAVTSVTITYDKVGSTAHFKAKFMSGLRYVVTVKGDSANHVIDVDNLALDGDKDPQRTPGGDFTSEFKLVQKFVP